MGMASGCGIIMGGVSPGGGGSGPAIVMPEHIGQPKCTGIAGAAIGITTMIGPITEAFLTCLLLPEQQQPQSAPHAPLQQSLPLQHSADLQHAPSLQHFLSLRPLDTVAPAGIDTHVPLGQHFLSLQQSAHLSVVLPHVPKSQSFWHAPQAPLAGGSAARALFIVKTVIAASIAACPNRRNMGRASFC